MRAGVDALGVVPARVGVERVLGPLERRARGRARTRRVFHYHDVAAVDVAAARDPVMRPRHVGDHRAVGRRGERRVSDRVDVKSSGRGIRPAVNADPGRSDRRVRNADPLRPVDLHLHGARVDGDLDHVGRVRRRAERVGPERRVCASDVLSEIDPGRLHVDLVERLRAGIDRADPAVHARRRRADAPDDRADRDPARAADRGRVVEDRLGRSWPRAIRSHITGTGRERRMLCPRPPGVRGVRRDGRAVGIREGVEQRHSRLPLSSRCRTADRACRSGSCRARRRSRSRRGRGTRAARPRSRRRRGSSRSRPTARWSTR